MGRISLLLSVDPVVALSLMSLEEEEGQNLIGHAPVRLELPCMNNVLNEDVVVWMDVMDFNVSGMVPESKLFCK